MNRVLFFLCITLIAGCKEKFVSPAPPVTTGYLVIEGVVNNGGETNIRLSRTTNLDDVNNKNENGAAVMLEANNSNTWSLVENSDGNYTISSLQLDTTLRYRLAIKTSNGEEYQSDYVAVKTSPPIDTINWVRDNAGVNLYVNTHDPQNNTRYYQWEFNETWEFHSSFSSILKYVYDVNNQPIAVTPRDASDPQIYTCWQSNASSTLLLGSTAKLSQDVVYLPLTKIPSQSWKLSVLYSILVKQYTWSKEGFEFLERMKKNTESVGTVFDAQPSEINGNIRCISNPNLPAIGFFNICTIREQRIFIYNQEVPNWGYRSGCTQESVENQQDSIAKKAVGKLPTSPDLLGPFNKIITFFAASESCVDCRLTGTNVKPSFWP